MKVDFICKKCGKKFIPNPDGIELEIRGETVKFLCPNCVNAEIKRWTIKDVVFNNKNYQPNVSFTLNDGTKHESFFMERDGKIIVTRVPEFCIEHVSQQLVPILVKHREESRKWNATVEFVEEFDSDYIKVKCEAIENAIIIKFRKRDDGSLWLNPQQTIPDRLLPQIESAWNKRQQQ